MTSPLGRTEAEAMTRDAMLAEAVRACGAGNEVCERFVATALVLGYSGLTGVLLCDRIRAAFRRICERERG